MELVNGGYLLARPSPRGEWQAAHLIPDMVLSASDCLSAHFPEVELYGSSGEDDESLITRYPDQFGSLEELLALRQHLSRMLDTGKLVYPNIFRSPEAAREFARQAFGLVMPPVLIGFSTSVENVHAITESAAEPSWLLEELASAIPPKAGQVLGWEVLTEDWGSFHSWLCCGIELVAEEWDVRPNEFGFIDSFEYASRVADYCNLPEAATEPGYWAPWQITQYAI